MVRAISDDSQLLEFGPVSQLLSGRARPFRAGGGLQRRELAFRHREPIVSESSPTIRRLEING
jgi:hypothetical protein